jgi:flagellar hook-associated protein 1 FlgK
MGNLFASLRGATAALSVFEMGMATVQNNVSNASTPGYAKQVQTLTADRFDLRAGLVGGVSAGAVVSTRSEYAEQSVRRQQEYFGAYDQKASDLAEIQPVFDITDGAGIPGALSNFFSSWSALSVTPNDGSARQTVLDRAGEVVRSFQETSNALTNADQAVTNEIQSNVDQLNQLAGQLSNLNADRQQSFHASEDAGSDAQVHNVLEQISQIANVSALKQDDGSYMLLLGGQTPIVVGGKSYPISADATKSPVVLLSTQGRDITSQITGGRLSGLMDVKNNTIPELTNGLNSMAESVADGVNSALATGVDANGQAPVKQLFTYDSTVGAANTLAITNITGAELTAASPGAPGGNANALKIAALATAKQANGETFSEAFAGLASKVGRDLNTAKSNADTHSQLLTQAQDLRSQMSGVSLDEEASHLIEFQRSYQAASKLVSILNDLTNTLINMI